jgi:hypothetical protein
MQAFEALIAEILESEGYWVRRGHKVGLIKEDKQKIGRPSSPRWEIDVLGYSAPKNLVLAVECKSYLDSPGVNLADIQGGRYAGRYKLFTESTLREVVLARLKLELVEMGLSAANPTVQLALAVGRLQSDPAALRTYFDDRGWLLFDPDWVRERLTATADMGYTDSVAVMVAKMLLKKRIGKGAGKLC